MADQLDPQRVAQIRAVLEPRETEDLLEIWNAHDTNEWTPEAFEAIRLLLTERLGTIPSQGPDPASSLAVARQYLEQARLHKVRHWFRLALAECEQAIQRAPRMAEAHFLSGRLYEIFGDAEKAILAYQETLRLDPTFPNAEEALEKAQESLVIEPDPEFEQALANLRQAKAERTAQAEQYLERARSLEAEDQLEKALAQCNLALNTDPHMATAYNVRGSLLENLGELEFAVQAYRQAIRLDPELVEASRNLQAIEADSAALAGQILEQARIDSGRGKFEKALHGYDRAIRLIPQSANPHNERGLILETIGRSEEAIQAYLQALHLDPDFSEARDNLHEIEREWEQTHPLLSLDELKTYFNEELDRSVDKDLDYVVESDEFVAEVNDLPAAYYLMDAQRILKGWPGHRNRPRHIGLDPLDRDFELAHLEGVVIRQIFTGQFRLEDPIALCFGIFMGSISLLPLLLGSLALIGGDIGSLIMTLLLGIYWVPGLVLLWNLNRNASDRTAGVEEENDE
jgi:tetratricopeptide (TPR) repeat protein